MLPAGPDPTTSTSNDVVDHHSFLMRPRTVRSGFEEDSCREPLLIRTASPRTCSGRSRVTTTCSKNCSRSDRTGVGGARWSPTSRTAVRAPFSTWPPGPQASRSHSPAVPNAHITGIDITEAMLRRGHARVARRSGGPRAARRRASRTASLSRRLVRRADVHLSVALRRRSRRDAARARTRPQTGRGDRQPGVLGPSEPVLAVLVVAVHARRVAGCGLPHRRS